MAKKTGPRPSTLSAYLYIPNIIVSIFGAVLDMVTDRISTACLLVVLSQVYKYCKPLVANVKVLYLILFFVSEDQMEKLMDVLAINLQTISVVSFLIATSFFGWAIKQIINNIQMKTTADVCVLYDINKK